MVAAGAQQLVARRDLDENRDAPSGRARGDRPQKLALERLVCEERVPHDEEVVVFNTGSGASYRF